MTDIEIDLFFQDVKTNRRIALIYIVNYKCYKVCTNPKCR